MYDLQLYGSGVSVYRNVICLFSTLISTDYVQKTWSWNGHIRALLKNGKKIQVRPFESIEDCLAK